MQSKNFRVPAKTRPYQCNQCQGMFCAPGKLKLHIEAVHLGLKPHKCDLCSKTFKSPGSKIMHIRRLHTKEKPFQCPLPNCHKEFVVNSDLDLHKKTHLPSLEREMFPCTSAQCQKTFTTKGTLRHHFNRAHLGGGYKCEFQNCGITCDTTTALSKHKRTHTKEQPYACTDSNCPKKFACKSHMLRHVQQKHIHPDLKPYSCSICPKMFKDKFTMKQHEKKHLTTRPYFKCDLCPAKYGNKWTLVNHMKDKHINSGRKYQCPHCHKIISSSANLQTHIKSQHTLLKREKLFKCYFCKKGFLTIHNVMGHVTRNHTGERAYPCEKCPKRFNESGNRNCHMKNAHVDISQRTKLPCLSCDKEFLTPSGRRKHFKNIHEGNHCVCLFCKKQFNQKTHLDFHIRTVHMKEKPFICEKCTYATAYKRCFRRHKLTH